MLNPYLRIEHIFFSWLIVGCKKKIVQHVSSSSTCIYIYTLYICPFNHSLNTVLMTLKIPLARNILIRLESRLVGHGPMGQKHGTQTGPRAVIAGKWMGNIPQWLIPCGNFIGNLTHHELIHHNSPYSHCHFQIYSSG